MRSVLKLSGKAPPAALPEKRLQKISVEKCEKCRFCVQSMMDNFPKKREKDQSREILGRKYLEHRGKSLPAQCIQSTEKLWSRLASHIRVVPPEEERAQYKGNHRWEIEGIRPDWSRDDSLSHGRLPDTGSLSYF